MPIASKRWQSKRKLKIPSTNTLASQASASTSRPSQPNKTSAQASAPVQAPQTPFQDKAQFILDVLDDLATEDHMFVEEQRAKSNKQVQSMVF
ncbi:hypothetical protein K470DRAFT_276345 [Piedraia hortae CBS 480.64]|uniref:Uncharacterized protein n=1 Tax=Piedraia hortae CBS 480.64 TaxID=1314780 RepID=A0A6A7C3A3_9PEZI|nr:hypothetical protein K470DRAFT_276345 [Piedraia hortae CBS 480.64]